jgi:hypothetical protein
LTLSVITAQGQTPEAPVLAQAALEKEKTAAESLEKHLPRPQVATKVAFDLDPHQEARLRKLLPKTLLKLKQREPLHILAVGDPSVFEVASQPGEPQMPSFAGIFATALAERFFYTGGMAYLGRGLHSAFGPSIALREASAQGVLSAVGMIEAEGSRMTVDLVMICHGQSDGAAAMPPPVFARAVEDAVDAARKLGADVLLCGPWLPMTASTEVAWGGVRPLCGVLATVAEQESVMMADLGNLHGLVSMPELGNADSARVFDAIDRACRGLFLEEPAGHYVPRPSLHHRLGQILFRQIIEGRERIGWEVGKATAEHRKADQLLVKFEVQNLEKEPVTLTLLPLVAGGWRPKEVTPSIALPPQGKRTISIEYTRASELAFSLEEPLVRLPVLGSVGSTARIVELIAPVRPLALVWHPATLFNQQEAFVANCQLINNASQDISGTWSAELGGTRLEGRFLAKGQGGTAPLDLRFELPTKDIGYQNLLLKVIVTAGGLRLEERRQVEIFPNLGLGAPVPLRSVGGGSSADAGISLTARADAARLVLECGVTDASWLQSGAGGGPAWQMEVNLDARSYGKRLERGATATLRVTGGAVDGPALVHHVAPWAFGNGYSAVFDPAEFAATLSTAPDGRRKISLSIPKTYLYLHEWALENGNSQLGINLRLTSRQRPLGGEEKLETYALSLNAKAPEDVESLIVLELSEKPTPRATINLY